LPEALSFIPIARPVLGEEEAEAVRRPLLSGWVTQGPEVEAFEREFAAAVGSPYACAVASGTAALHLALLCVGVRPGDEVVTASHSFIATANAVRHCGAEPVFADVHADTFNLDVRSVERAIGPRTRAILCVHQIGMPCDLHELAALARARGLALVEDAACAVGSEIRWEERWEPIGRPRGDVACFSFHPRKVMTTGDGGMLTTARGELDQAFRRLRHHGMSISDLDRHRAADVVFEEYPVVGWNYRLTDVQAAIGRVQLRRLPELVARRRALAARYAERLAGVPGVVPPVEPEWARSNWQSYCVRLPDAADQRRVMQRMLDVGVASRRGVQCAHREKAYADLPLRIPLPESERAQDHCILLPLFPGLSEGDQERVVAALADALSAVG
jgi:dTDP-4-amino-4,6-dideoxygalactose transaminase